MGTDLSVSPTRYPIASMFVFRPDSQLAGDRVLFYSLVSPCGIEKTPTIALVFLEGNRGLPGFNWGGGLVVYYKS